MSDDQIRIRDDDGQLTEAGIALGLRRMERFVEGHAKVQAMTFFLAMTVVERATAKDYSDEALRQILRDANDVRAAADEWCSTIGRMVDAWREQREAEAARIARDGDS